ncbi:MAG: hydrogenase maturation nickel metallochaperone HypA [Anaerolineales bacterium]|nr:hydrogenase maturation nickel metallochaperone HypA [Anaerolineales bacterium]
MHELSVTQNILEIALRHAEEADADKITSLTLTIGRLASIVDDSVQFYWDIISAGTIAEGSSLVFDRIDPEIQCSVCQHIYYPGETMMACPECGSVQVKVIKGEEFFLSSIDIDKQTEKGS